MLLSWNAERLTRQSEGVAHHTHVNANATANANANIQTNIRDFYNTKEDADIDANANTNAYTIANWQVETKPNNKQLTRQSRKQETSPPKTLSSLNTLPLSDTS